MILIPEEEKNTLNVTESILGTSMTSFEAQPCVVIISAKSLHEASQTEAYLPVSGDDDLAHSHLEFGSVYVRVVVECRSGNLSVFSPLVTVCINDVWTPESVQ